MGLQKARTGAPGALGEREGRGKDGEEEGEDEKVEGWGQGVAGATPQLHRGTSAHAVRFELGVCTERACAYLKYLQDDGARKRMGRAWLDKMAEPKTMV